MEAILAESLFYDSVTATIRVHIDELDGPYSNTRLKILDDLAEDSRKMRNIFKTVKTVAITLISKYNTIDPIDLNPEH